MKIHEYQAKGIFKESGIPVPNGQVVKTPEEAGKVCKTVDGPPWVVKAQVHAGGRGKGGGVKVVGDTAEVVSTTEAMLASALVTPQTGPEGVTVHQVLIEEGVEIDRELYLGMVIDRQTAMPAMIFSPAGGMSIEEVAAQTPELIWTESVDPATGWMPYQARNLAYRLDPLPEPGTLKELMAVMAGLYGYL
jgi:succinyl-CoA synthetase beta subunit